MVLSGTKQANRHVGCRTVRVTGAVLVPPQARSQASTI